jgi:hypothetical protein
MRRNSMTGIGSDTGAGTGGADLFTKLAIFNNRQPVYQ